MPKTGPRATALTRATRGIKKLKCGPINAFLLGAVSWRGRKIFHSGATAAAHSIFGPIKSLVVFLRCPAVLFWISGSRPGVKGAQRIVRTAVCLHRTG